MGFSLPCRQHGARAAEQHPLPLERDDLVGDPCHRRVEAEGARQPELHVGVVGAQAVLGAIKAERQEPNAEASAVLWG